MMHAQLKAYRIEKLEFANNLKAGAKIELQNKFSYKVGHSPNNTCKGEMTADVTDKENPENFHIHITISGIFTTEPGFDQTRLHFETYDMLFPYLRAAVSMFTSQAGVAPIYLPYTDISGQEVYSFKAPKKNPGEGPVFNAEDL